MVVKEFAPKDLYFSDSHSFRGLIQRSFSGIKEHHFSVSPHSIIWFSCIDLSQKDTEYHEAGGIRQIQRFIDVSLPRLVLTFAPSLC